MGGLTGDFHSDKGFTNDIWEYQISKNLWTKLKFTGTPPVPRELHTMTGFRGQAVMFGGFHEGGVSNEVYSLDLTSLEWTLPLDDGRIPESRQGAASIVLGDSLFMTSGCDYSRKTCYSDLYLLDLTTMWWTLIQPFRGSDSFTSREKAAMTSVGQTLFLFGGCQLYSYCLNDLIAINTGITCPNDCWNNGVCRNGVCLCDPGYIGIDCEIRTRCEANCHYQGLCNGNAVCDCYPGYIGSICQTWVNCPNNCTAEINGVCQGNGECKCSENYYGQDCKEFSLCGECAHGRCDEQECVCSEGWEGKQCSSPVVTTSETENEEVETLDISTPSNTTAALPNNTPEPSNISIEPTNTTADSTDNSPPQPVSALEFPLEDLSHLHAPNCAFNCHNHGICHEDVCFCSSEYTGTYCEVRKTHQVSVMLVVGVALAALSVGLMVSCMYIRKRNTTLRL